MMKPLFIILHHTASRKNTTVQDVDDWHKLRWPDFKSSLGYYVGYQYLIEGNGNTIQTRRNEEEGAHTLGGYNQKSIGIALTGNFDLEEPNVPQLSALSTLLERLKKEYDIPDSKILGHKQVWATSCPGKNLSKWLNLYKQLNILQKIVEILKQLFKGRTY